MSDTMAERIKDGLVAGAVAGVVSGAPSTVYAIATGRSPLEATRAAGSILAPRGGAPAQVAAAVPVHTALSLGWGVILSFALPRRSGLLWGAAGGAAIAALDLGGFGHRFPAIRALPPLPQVADHVAFGAVAGWVLAGRRRVRHEPGGR